MLYEILTQRNLANNELLRLTGLPKETLRSFKISIADLLEDAKGDRVKFSSLGRTEVSNLRLRPYKWTLFTLTPYTNNTQTKKDASSDSNTQPLFDTVSRLQEIRKSYFAPWYCKKRI